MEGMSRDRFNLQKLIVVLTAAGKVGVGKVGVGSSDWCVCGGLCVC